MVDADDSTQHSDIKRITIDQQRGDFCFGCIGSRSGDQIVFRPAGRHLGERMTGVMTFAAIISLGILYIADVISQEIDEWIV